MSLPIVRIQNPPQIGMALESDSEHIVDFPLIPVGRGPEIGDGIGYGIFTLQPHFQAQTGRRVKREKVIDKGIVWVTLTHRAVSFTT
jgi:hypothetical protein